MVRKSGRSTGLYEIGFAARTGLAAKRADLVKRRARARAAVRKGGVRNRDWVRSVIGPVWRGRLASA